MAHAHSHAGHSHHHAADFGRAFLVGIVLNGVFVAVEIVFGLRARSMSLLADAGHNMSDVLSLGLAWTASVLTLKPATKTHTYGLRGSSILAALANSMLLLAAVGAVGWEAIRRLFERQPVEGGTMAWVAVAGIVVNATAAIMFAKGSKGDLNLRAAFVHLAGDAAMALAVLVGGLLIVATGQTVIDPILSLLIVGLILWNTWALFKESLHYATQAVPPGVDLEHVRSALCALKGVSEVHDLHIWGMSTTEVALTAHLVVPGDGRADELLAEANEVLRNRFDIHHATLQIERGNGRHPCPTDCGAPE